MALDGSVHPYTEPVALNRVKNPHAHMLRERSTASHQGGGVFFLTRVLGGLLLLPLPFFLTYEVEETFDSGVQVEEHSFSCVVGGDGDCCHWGVCSNWLSHP